MSRHFSVLAGLMLLCAPIAPGATPAEAAGIGVHLTVHAQNIARRLQAVAGEHNPHVGLGEGAQSPSRLHPNTRRIQLDTAGESAATRSPR